MGIGEMAEWLMAADCKSADESLRRFESFFPHYTLSYFCGSSSVGRATAFQAVGRGFEPRLPLDESSGVMLSHVDS